MSVVWKYELDVRDEQVLELPQDADLLYVANQSGEIDKITLWARVTPTLAPERRVIIMRGTGQPIWQQPYVGTVLTANGALVWHIFDGGVEEDETNL